MISISESAAKLSFENSIFVSAFLEYALKPLCVSLNGNSDAKLVIFSRILFPNCLYDGMLVESENL